MEQESPIGWQIGQIKVRYRFVDRCNRVATVIAARSPRRRRSSAARGENSPALRALPRSSFSVRLREPSLRDDLPVVPTCDFFKSWGIFRRSMHFSGFNHGAYPCCCSAAWASIIWCPVRDLLAGCELITWSILTSYPAAARGLRPLRPGSFVGREFDRAEIDRFAGFDGKLLDQRPKD